MKEGFIEGIFGLITDVFKGLYSAIKPVIKIISTITKMLQPLFEIFGNIIFSLFAPLIAILRPLAMLMRKMLLPFQKSAMKLIRLGNIQYEEGNVEEAAKFWSEGVATALAGVLYMFLYALGPIFSNLANVFFLILRPLLELMGMSPEEIDQARNDIANKINNFFTGTANGFKNTVIKWATEQAGTDMSKNFLANTDDYSRLLLKFGIGTQFYTSSTAYYASSLDNMTDKAISTADQIIADAQAEAERIRAAARSSASESGGGE